MIPFPFVGDSSAAAKLADLERLLDRSLTNTQYIEGKAASRLFAALLKSYSVLTNPANGGPSNSRLASLHKEGKLLGVTLAAAFDLVCNAEYLHGRTVNSNWIYCDRDGQTHAYYSFLKQCPRCCLDRGLEKRLAGAQHKPTSHHIGEITTVATALVLQFIAAANHKPFEIATITKQSHDVDAVGFGEDLIVLFEMKSSPMVTFPLVADLDGPLVQADESGQARPYDQHKLLDLDELGRRDLGLYLPHHDLKIPLASFSEPQWPYPSITSWIESPENTEAFLLAWVELYEAYSVPKTQRKDRDVVLAYLVNGWGDEIDSNKTKPGLGRTDDIKKGTYQLLKFGSYYRDDRAQTAVRGALVANLDPLFLRANYLDGLLGARWGNADDFIEEDGRFSIESTKLRFLYDGILTLNDPVINDPRVAEIFDLKGVASALESGRLDTFLTAWGADGPDAVVDDVASSG